MSVDCEHAKAVSSVSVADDGRRGGVAAWRRGGVAKHGAKLDGEAMVKRSLLRGLHHVPPRALDLRAPGRLDTD
jgi:hypothetical protein